MGNEQFKDVGILNTLVSLQRSGMLHEEDRQELTLLLSPWGKAQVEELLKSNGAEGAPSAHRLEQGTSRFSP